MHYCVGFQIKDQQLSSTPGVLRISEVEDKSDRRLTERSNSTKQQQMEVDEDLARRLQAKEEAKNSQSQRCALDAAS